MEEPGKESRLPHFCLTSASEIRLKAESPAYRSATGIWLFEYGTGHVCAIHSVNQYRHAQTAGIATRIATLVSLRN